MAAQGLSVFPITHASSARNQSCGKTFEQVLSFNLWNSLVGSKLCIQPSSLGLTASGRRRSTVATISFCLPNTKKEGIEPVKEPVWSARAIKSFAMAELEVAKLKYPKIGTDALILGILVEGTSLTAKFLREIGITIFKARDETLKLLGRTSMSYPTPVDPPLTSQAWRAMRWAREEKQKSGEGGEITVAYMLLGIWSIEESAGHIILANLGFDDDKAKELEKTKDKDVILSIRKNHITV